MVKKNSPMVERKVKKSGLKILGFILGLSAVFYLILHSWWHLPFVPERIKNNFLLNASIVPASDDSRSLFIAINPGFRAEFGDKQMPESAFLRFEVTETTTSGKLSTDIERNLKDSWQNLNELFHQYQPGIEWQLFAAGVDEQEMTALSLTQNEELLQMMKEIKGEEIIATASTQLPTIISEQEKIKTSTQVRRDLGFDVIENLAVAEAVDLNYRLLPGKGVKSEIVLGDRKNFDTACLQLLSLGISEEGCDLPKNSFSFLLKLDPGQSLVHSPLSLETGKKGSYYIKSENQPLLRLANPVIIDQDKSNDEQVELEVKPAELNGELIADYYVVTFKVNLSWLLDKDRNFPLKITSGFFIDDLDFFAQEEFQ